MIHETASTEQEYRLLLQEIEELREENRKLQDQLKKANKAVTNAERAASEAARAHNKMVETLTETMRENNALTIDRDMWKARAQRASAQTESNDYPYNIRLPFSIPDISEDEAGVIRKAIARLHHPDFGGNAERMKMWNAALDRLERRT
jgi:chromosome segregation ATPase